MTAPTSPASGALPKPFGYVRDNYGDGHVFQHIPFNEHDALMCSTAEVYSRSQMLAALASREAIPAPLTVGKIVSLGFRGTQDEAIRWARVIEGAHGIVGPASLASPQVAPALTDAQRTRFNHLKEAHKHMQPLDGTTIKGKDLFALLDFALAAPAPVAPTLTRQHIDNAQEVADSRHGVFTWGEAPGSWRETFAHEIARSIGAPVAPTPAQPSEDARDAARYRFLREVPFNDEIRRVMSLQLNALMDGTIDAAMSATLPSEPEGEATPPALKEQQS